ncbi:MAG: hypothetical protein AB7R69_04170 [Candidatus Babeliales bacterium]
MNKYTTFWGIFFFCTTVFCMDDSQFMFPINLPMSEHQIELDPTCFQNIGDMCTCVLPGPHEKTPFRAYWDEECYKGFTQRVQEKYGIDKPIPEKSSHDYLHYRASREEYLGCCLAGLINSLRCCCCPCLTAYSCCCDVCPCLDVCPWESYACEWFLKPVCCDEDACIGYSCSACCFCCCTVCDSQ